MKKSTYESLGIPTSLSITLSTVGLVLALAPVLGGTDLGVLKLPLLSDERQALLRWLGPALFLVLMAGYFPSWQSPGRVRALKKFLSPTEAVELFESIVKTKEKEELLFVVYLTDGTVFNGRLSAMSSGGTGGYMISFRLPSGSNRGVLFRDLKGIEAS